jgi:hypothetical protein
MAHNSVAQTAALLICIREVSGSILVRDADYSGWDFSLFPLAFLQANASTVTTVSFHILSSSLFINPDI